MTQADRVHSTPPLNTSSSVAMSEVDMQITSINHEPPDNFIRWWGQAIDGDQKYKWFFAPHRRCASTLQMQIEEIPSCWMTIDPPSGAKRVVINAIRRQRRKSASGRLNASPQGSD